MNLELSAVEAAREQLVELAFTDFTSTQERPPRERQEPVGRALAVGVYVAATCITDTDPASPGVQSIETAHKILVSRLLAYNKHAGAPYSNLLWRTLGTMGMRDFVAEKRSTAQHNRDWLIAQHVWRQPITKQEISQKTGVITETRRQLAS